MTPCIQFCGDLWLPEGPHVHLPEWMSKQLVFNLEGPVTARGIPYPNKICLATDAEAFRAAFPHTPLAACLANNHILDYGRPGFEDTIALLDDMDIEYFGAGTKENRCNNPLVIETDGISVGLLGYACPSTNPVFASGRELGVAPLDLDWIREDLEEAKARGAARIIVCIHWGAEDVGLPKPADVALARTILDLGVDLIIGHHAHCIQPVLTVGEKCAFFGLGNASFPDFEYRVEGKVMAWGIQRPWNRTSLVVQYVPTTNAVTWQAIREHSGRIEVHETTIGQIKVWDSAYVDADARYSRRFRNAQRFSHARLALSRFLARPKWPSVHSLTHIIQALRRGD